MRESPQSPEDLQATPSLQMGDAGSPVIASPLPPPPPGAAEIAPPGSKVSPEAFAELAYARSRTFLARLPDARIIRLRRVATITVILLFVAIIPGMNVLGWIADYRLNLLGKYLSFTIVALGIDLIWGYTGLLSLTQALFFCLGGYAMAMHLSLPQGGGDVRPEYNNIPQFMFFNNVRELPFFWKPFTSFPLTVLLGLLVPGGFALVFGYFILRSRVRGVYFSIVTQALAFGAWLLISRNEMLLGGTNGLTNFKKDLTQSHGWILFLYLLTVVMIALSYLLCRVIVRSRLGRLLLAVRDRESRLYFAGYQPYAYKLFAFVVAGMLGGLSGMLYTPQVTIISPYSMRVAESILMVVWVAVGGRGKLWGAIFGTILICYCESILTSDLPSVWPFVEGGIFLAVVLYFPDGFVGMWNDLEEQVQRGSSRFTALVSILPMLLLATFVLVEGLGLMPPFLRKVAFSSQSLGDVQLKYLVLVAAIAACVGYRWLIRYSKSRANASPTVGSVAAGSVGGAA